MNKALERKITKAFKHTGLSVVFGDGWVSVMRGDGIHAEFNTCFGDDAPDDMLTGIYTIDGKETEIDLHVPSEIDELVDVCKSILYSEELPEMGEAV